MANLIADHIMWLQGAFVLPYLFGVLSGFALAGYWYGWRPSGKERKVSDARFL